MIGKMIGALVGGRVAQQARGIEGPTGALLGVVATTALRRISLPTMIALGAGGYFAKKYFDKQKAEEAAPPALEDKSVSTAKATTGEPIAA
jgi:hypothetical protein